MKDTVPNGEMFRVYHFRPLLAWRLMALRVLSFYFLISNLVAVVLRFFEGLKQNWLHEKKCATPLCTFPCPLELASTVPISPSESWGSFRAFLMALPKKKALFFLNRKK
jgi:hypothetical protein